MYAGGLEGTRNKFVIALDAFACRFVNLFIHTNVRNLPNRSRNPTTTTAIAYPKMSSLLQVANIARIACYSLRSLGLATYFYDFDVSCACLRLSDQSAKNCVRCVFDSAFRGYAMFCPLLTASLRFAFSEWTSS